MSSTAQDTNGLMMRRLDAGSADFESSLQALIAWESVSDTQVAKTVADIIADVRARGDAAVADYTQRFDRGAVVDVSPARMAEARAKIAPEVLSALEFSAERIRTYHQRQMQDSWSYTEADGTVLGQKITPMDRVGLYVPGGKAAYPSSVLMTAVPAKVAGVGELIIVSPSPNGELNNLVLAAADVAGVDRLVTIGGAQAVAALAYGTETIPKVDKIVGPGNIFVATAKMQVFGQVGLDMFAGPSEILVICDGQTDPDWVAMDLFSQAEHDEQAQSILISPSQGFIDAVLLSMDRLIAEMPRAAIIRESINNRGAAIKVADLQEAIDVCNRIAPEHLELSVADPEALLPHIRHAGAIFMGRHTPEALGDYSAGPSHVLPTSGTARFSSPLGVYDFQKRSSIIQCSPNAKSIGDAAATLAWQESLPAHARSAEMRWPPENKS